MRSSLVRIVIAFGMLAFVSGAVAKAQSGDEGKRKVKTRINPRYPDLARNMGIGGKVKIQVVIAADGHVKDETAVGGHPLLVQACIDAIKDWKFEPGPAETTQIIEFDFATPK